jgi:hypothetical protein
MPMFPTVGPGTDDHDRQLPCIAQRSATDPRSRAAARSLFFASDHQQLPTLGTLGPDLVHEVRGPLPQDLIHCTTDPPRL